MANDSNTTSISPTRRLKAKERAVFERVTAEFSHLVPSDSEQITQYAEASVRYEMALKVTNKNPIVTLPVVNRKSGNVTGHKTIRNPAYITLREASAQMVSLGRRLLIDAHSTEKRLRMQSKKARSFAGVEGDAIAEREIRAALTEDQIEEAISSNRRGGYTPPWCETAEMERNFAIYWLVANALLGVDEDGNEWDANAGDALTDYLKEVIK